MEFEWDEGKGAANESKHGVSFEEAKTVFGDPLYVDFYDPDHSDDEHRYLIMGESNRGRLLMVSYAESGDAVRLISARQAAAENEALRFLIRIAREEHPTLPGMGRNP